MDDWPEVEAINVQGTRNVVDVCLQCGVRRLIGQSPGAAVSTKHKPAADDLIAQLLIEVHNHAHDILRAKV